jgi:hypothetical protein
VHLAAAGALISGGSESLRGGRAGAQVFRPAAGARAADDGDAGRKSEPAGGVFESSAGRNAGLAATAAAAAAAGGGGEIVVGGDMAKVDVVVGVGAGAGISSADAGCVSTAAAAAFVVVDTAAAAAAAAGTMPRAARNRSRASRAVRPRAGRRTGCGSARPASAPTPSADGVRFRIGAGPEAGRPGP